MFDHFLLAQENVYSIALAELRAGQKRTHWMWFIFPQIAGLGSSEMARRFSLSGLKEAQDYLNNPILGERLKTATLAVLNHAPGTLHPRNLDTIFGFPDDLKFCSSMTLFHQADLKEAVFNDAITRFCEGRQDSETLKRL